MTIFNRKSGRFDPEYVQGVITANNLNQAGDATPGSAVEVDVSDAATATIQITGTHGGAKSLQATVDGVTWVTIAATNTIRNEASGAVASSIASGATGLFSVDVTGFIRARISAPSTGTTGSATVTIFTAAEPKPRGTA